jgi:tetratricopeptide (TPR) repeat protein/TolB-like protein
LTPSVGMRFGRYELLSKLGTGGMGEVFRARDHDLHRDVAIKFLPERYASDPIRLGRFEQESRAASSLNHPNIVTIHEIGQTSGLHYIVMELVEGETLRAMLRGGPLPARRTLDIASQLADGLAKAHAAEIVHRDLKPENVMVTNDGFVKVLDFGLAKLRARDSGDDDVQFDSEHPTLPDSPASPQTAAGVLVGTVGYMSPEQARGRSIDYRSDQFSFGAILYEMAAGKQAFQRETRAQTLTAIIETSPEPLEAFAPALPPPARWIVERCLEKDPSERYASTLDLAREIRNVRERLAEVRSGSSADGTRGAGPVRAASRLGWVVATTVLAVLLAFLVGPLRTCVRPPLPARKQVAVLPFTNASGGVATQAFCDGLVETLSTKLTQLEQFQNTLWVVPSSEVRAARVDSGEAARRAFGVTLVVTGSVQRSGGTVRLTANLVDTTSLRQLRAVVLDAERDDPVALQDGLVRQVAHMLELEISPEADVVLAAGRTSVATAWELYVEGRGQLQRYQDLESVERAVTAFQRALQRDPDYALAYAGLGEAHWRRYQLTRDASSVDLARRACEKALALNDLLAPVHVTLGIINVGTGQPEQALEDFDRALDLDPADADALREKSLAYEALGRVQEAEATLLEAVRLRPDFWGTHSWLGVHYWRQGRYEEAERAFRRALRLAPENVRTRTNLGGILHVLGRDQEAVRSLQHAMAIRPTYGAAANLGAIEFDRGHYAQAARAYEKAIEIDDHDYRVWRNLALSYRWAPGESERARNAWERAARLAEGRLTVNPDDPAVLADLADCHAALDDPGRARQEVARALELAPDDVEIQQVAAAVYERLGNRIAALRWMGRALAGGYPRELIERDPSLTALVADPRFPGPRAVEAPAEAGSAEPH